MFYEIAEKYTDHFYAFLPYGTIDNRASFEALDPEWKKESIRLAESFRDYSFPAMLATDFLEFSRTGNRVHYEDKFFKKRLALNAFVLAECVENSGRYIDQIINGIFSICEESAWQLPPHNSYENTPNYPLPDSTEPVLDLFACETGAVLACTYYLLKNKLDEVSPFITKRILSELEHRIYVPYLQKHFWWMGNGKDPMCNWTIWCTQNVLLSAFLNDTLDPAVAREIFLKACQSVDFFLADYGEDGCCDEGAQYYRHAGLCLFNTMEVLNAVTDGAFDELYSQPKIKNIAEYIFNVHVQDKYFVNFADCSPVAGRAGVREYLFAKRIKNDTMRAFAAADFIAGKADTLLLPAENNLFYRLQNAFTVSEISEFAKTVSDVIPHKDIYYPSTGVFIVRDPQLFLAVKAGNNGDSHNHNDTGSFTVYKSGKPFFIDLGVESYTKKTFSADRYEIWTMQSAYHNLPDINGKTQAAGKQYGAKVLSCHLTRPNPAIEIDITGAYPDNAIRYIRKVTLIKGKEIVIEDRISPSYENTVLNFMTYEKPVLKSVNGGGSSPDALTLSVGNLGQFFVSGAMLIKIEAIPVTDPRLMAAWEHEVYRIRLAATNHLVEMHIC